MLGIEPRTSPDGHSDDVRCSDDGHVDFSLDGEGDAVANVMFIKKSQETSREIKCAFELQYAKR